MCQGERGKRRRLQCAGQCSGWRGLQDGWKPVDRNVCKAWGNGRRQLACCMGKNLRSISASLLLPSPGRTPPSRILPVPPPQGSGLNASLPQPHVTQSLSVPSHRRTHAPTLLCSTYCGSGCGDAQAVSTRVGYKTCKTKRETTVLCLCLCPQVCLACSSQSRIRLGSFMDIGTRCRGLASSSGLWHAPRRLHPNPLAALYT